MHIIVKLLKIQEKEKNLKKQLEKNTLDIQNSNKQKTY